MSTESTFPALPVRQRGTLEIIDTAMKLYRRYFGVLMGWSALTAVLFVVTASFTCGLGAILVYPLIPGSACCAIAAAVRGQRIGFGQVWDFTKPRFGALIGITLLSVLLMSTASGVLSMVFTLISVGGAWIFSLMNAPDSVILIFGIIGVIIGTLLSSILSVLAYAWLGLIPIIACLEDDKRSTAALGRAWELMKGSWTRVLGLATLLSIAIVAVMGIVAGSMALFGSGIGAFTDPSETAIIGLMLTFTGFIGLFLLFWNPIQTLVLTVLYLDLRVRKEALDLEWSSYSSAPPAQTDAPATSAAELAAGAATPELAPASLSGYAPGSSAPANAPAPDLSPLTLTPQAATAPLVPAPEATVSLIKEETSSFSSAPATPISLDSPVAPASDTVAPISLDSPAPTVAPEPFDFSSSFSTEQAEDLFSPNGEPEKRNETEVK